ncbi:MULTISPECIES: thioredoxin [Weeksella]|uniref:Thioredoxin n=1 Tax=Weeksella virosa (strain ATCC 43766 / DSM 16922 / JCM 21250 / CCUG 30538 / CDC 9751 / IAM 14551 / NBRC 16016 / NCTC 11634 / CL345/78) TaxID=865938 RepID=F0P256_WEEVC|nr:MULTISPECIES: thioredoxin [Weeksella]ADX67746.1 thioredoxin [Weeksella virosa DSM 16922]MDK7374037.1 thioredoxin [Weeksella virosa]MDK7674292.1 thioredoxin [Weeksella virosa]OFM82722.1 thiol reductase thioredoxin [Weeksella sp. HMSC059D05]SUP54045.1 Thioredoxin [Weeksella virosa]
MTFNEIINSNEKVLVDFFATWCGPCQMMHPILEQLKEEVKDGVKIIKIDIDKNQALAARYRVQGVPTFILFRNGQQVWKESGARNKESLLQVIQQH